MLPTLIQFGKYMFILSYYFIENRQSIVSLYSLYDFTKFTFYVCDSAGVMEIIKTKLKEKYNVVKPSLIEIVGAEHSELGDFEIMNIM